jgi:fibronectin type 3 domain-containing protein
VFRRAQLVLWLAALVGAAFAASSAGQGPPGGTPPGFDQAVAAKQKHAERILDKPGVAGIGVGLNPAGKPVIEIYKEKAEVADLPDELEGVPVDSVTTGLIEPRDHLPTHRYPRPVPIGVSAGLAGVATGTLGVRVTNGTNVYALSNNHVFAGVNTASIGDPIISPGDVDGGSDPADRIGTLAAYQTIDFSGGTNTMDAAIALTSTANVGFSTPADGYGTPSPVTVQPFVGQAVQKYGRTTGLQLGDVVATNLSVDVCYIAIGEFCLQEARFAGQISISPGPFSAPGDSGSLIVTQGANEPVALLFAGGDGLTIGTPIDLVLQRFGVTIDGVPPDGTPSAPTALSALAGDASASLSWTAPSFDGGSPVSGYKVYRDTSPNPTSAIATLGVQTSYVDSGLQNGTTYYYKVSALNANGESPLSSQSAATPSGLVPPSEPLPTVDAFDRTENPLSDAGRWSNGINGSIETGLYTTSNQLACSKTSTCTAWRNAAQYGPDVEVWARLSTLPGANNQLRLLARIQQPGTSTYDGYMLRPNQLAGTDQILFERVDNGAIVNLLTVNQEFAAGDVFLLRVKGSTVEAWRHDGSTWSRLGTISDSTYPNVGSAGIGMRGTTGRADDFGARTLGVPPPDTEPPSAPGTLTANALSSSQIDLSWGPATDNVAVTFYRVERCSGSGCSSFAEVAASTSTTHLDVGLAASTDYSYRVRAVDAADNEGPYSNTASTTTPAPPDTEPPTAPTGLSATAMSPTQIDLSWTAASDNVAVTLYRVERCQGAGCSVFTEIGTTASTSFASTGLTASTSYSYRVRAQDVVPNIGPYSSTASATTQAPPDTAAPTAPGTPVATATSAIQIDLSWTAAIDNVAVTLYRVERCQGAGCSSFAEIGTTASTSYSDTGLSASTAYSYRVRAQDAVPNVGPYSGTASATTQSGVVTPSEPLPTLDSFNRPNENALTGNWSNGIIGPAETGLRLRSNAIECTKTSTCTAWRNNAFYGPDAEVWARVTTLPGTGNQFRLYARLQGAGSSAQTGYMLRTNQLAGTDQVLLDRLDGAAVVNRLTIAHELAVGDTILLRVKGTTLEAWLKRGTTWSLLGSAADSTYAAAGRVGVGIRGKTGRLDDFGAR